MLTVNNVSLEVVDNHANSTVLVIPGFSIDAYNSTVEHCKTIKSNVAIVKFNGVSDYAKQHVYVYESGSTKKVKAETAMYKKLATLILGKIKPLKNVTLLAKSAGAGVAWYLLKKKQIPLVYLQAPGFSDLTSPIKPPKCNQIYLAWNEDDDKIPYKTMPKVYKYIRDTIAKSSYDTLVYKKTYPIGKHEWQSAFIALV